MVTAGESAHGRQPLSRLPANALILAFTPLIDQRFAADLLALHRAGRPLMVVQIVLDDLYPPPADPADVLARRIFALSIDQWRDDLVNRGVPLARWTAETDLGGIVGGAQPAAPPDSGGLERDRARCHGWPALAVLAGIATAAVPVALGGGVLVAGLVAGLLAGRSVLRAEEADVTTAIVVGGLLVAIALTRGHHAAFGVVRRRVRQRRDRRARPAPRSSTTTRLPAPRWRSARRPSASG